MRTIIIDDERLARKELRKLLDKYEFIEVLEECTNAEEAKKAIESLKPDLIFLDIQMPEKTGFDLLKELDHTPQVIFVTAYDEYAMKAFEVNAFDYILKPVEEVRLSASLEKVQKEMEEIAEIKQSLNQVKLNFSDYIFIKDGEKCWFTKLGEVRYFESVGNYVKVYFENEKPMLLKSLSKIEDRLEDKLFFRANRKIIVNLDWIQKIDTWFSGGLKLTLKSGEEIEMSRRQAQKFKELKKI